MSLFVRDYPCCARERREYAGGRNRAVLIIRDVTCAQFTPLSLRVCARWYVDCIPLAADRPNRTIGVFPRHAADAAHAHAREACMHAARYRGTGIAHTRARTRRVRARPRCGVPSHKKFTVQRPLFFNDAAAGVATLNGNGREMENAGGSRRPRPLIGADRETDANYTRRLSLPPLFHPAGVV